MLDKNEEMDTMEPHKLEIIDLLGEIGMFFFSTNIDKLFLKFYPSVTIRQDYGSVFIFSPGTVFGMRIQEV